MLREVHVVGNTLPEAYHKALYALYSSNDDMEISLTMEVKKPFMEPRISRLFPGGFCELEQYRQEMMDGILDFEVERGNWHYTYHQRYAPYLEDVIKLLQDDPTSRRAVISIRDNELDLGSGDPACLQSIQFMIRNKKLHCFVLFRSNDGVRAAFMNAFALTELQKYVADRLGVRVGSYIHRANSFHCYPESRDTLRSYCKRICTAGGALTYNYEGEWDALMESAKPKVEKTVAEQRKKYDSEKRQTP